MWCSIGTGEARVWLFPSVGTNMLPQIVFGGSTIAAVWAGERLFTCVGSNVFCHVVFPNSRVHTEGTEVHLADASLPHIARTITIHSHLLAMPSFIKHILQKIFMPLFTLIIWLKKDMMLQRWSVMVNSITDLYNFDKFSKLSKLISVRLNAKQ